MDVDSPTTGLLGSCHRLTSLQRASSSPHQHMRRSARAPWLLLAGTLCALVVVAFWWPRSPCMTQVDRERFTQAAVSSLDKMAAQVRTLVQQRDAAQENIKKLAAELLKAQTAADKLYRQGGAAAAPPNADAASARTAQGEASTSRHAVWHPSAERAAASRNAELARVLREIAVRDEVAVAISNERLAADGHMLEFWCKHMQRVGVVNHLVVALDDVTLAQARKFGSHAVKVAVRGDAAAQSLQTGSSHAVSGLKFQILQEFLELGYAVLLSDVDILTVQNPFKFLARDADVEGMSDGWDAAKAYGFNDVFDSPEMGWSRYSHSMRVSVINSGLFYMRPTRASLAVLRLVFERIETEHGWDQALFNEALFLPSRPGYAAPGAAVRVLDRHLFLNSKTLFVHLRKDAELYARTRPVMVHVNYHADKWPRLRAAARRYVDGDAAALDAFSDAS